MTCRPLPVLFFMIGICLPALAHARTIQDPMADFIATESVIEAGHYKNISLAEVDLNGDGKKLVFLSNNYVRHAGMLWTVYIPSKGGYTRGVPKPREAELLCFLPEHCYVGYIPEIKRRGLVFFVGRIVYGFAFTAFWIEDGKPRLKRIGHTKPPKTDNDPAGPLFQKYFPDLGNPDRKSPFTEKLLTADDLRAKGYVIPKIDP